MNNLTQKLLIELERKIKAFVPNPMYPHDVFIVITLHEAIAAAKEGNFGVGAVLVRENGEIIQRGHNRVFKPYFRSDLHAEMDVMTKFEEQFKNIDSLKGFILFSSLEPCPMCFVRLIISGVKKVYYAAIDQNGGMVHRLEYVPPEWKELAQRQEFALAQCSSELRDIALKIFLSTVNENDKKLQNRSLLLGQHSRCQPLPLSSA
ncbi:nucleoside deaminase [Candidatus Poribacteria bacterium]|nr:nucleoside deaminase [Candidatus Poribacteria bacterium]